jgi:cytoskeleton protein RodZ
LIEIIGNRFWKADVIELAQHLKSERLEQGLSLSDIAQKAGVGIGLLKALEAGQFSEIGPPPLIRSLLTAYSQALGNSQPPALNERESPPGVDAPDSTPSPQEERTLRLSKGNKTIGILSFLFLAVVALGVFFRAGAIPWRTLDHPPPQAAKSEVVNETHLPPQSPPEATVIPDANAGKEISAAIVENQDHPGRVSPQPLQGEQTDEAAPSTVPAESKGGWETSPIEPASLRHLFEIEAVQPSWVEVRTDSKKTEAALLQPGEKRAWQVAQEVLIVLGNAGGIQMKWDGIPVNLGGKPGQVLRIRLPHPDLTGRSP